jgi:hypothetical protein
MTSDPKSNPGGDGEIVEATDASSGQKTGHIRWVLVIGTFLAIAGLVAVWLIISHKA